MKKATWFRIGKVAWFIARRLWKVKYADELDHVIVAVEGATREAAIRESR